MAEEYFRCLVPECKDVHPTLNALALHYGRSHRGIPMPAKKDTIVQEVPEGYTLVLPKEKPKSPEEPDARPKEPIGSKGAIYKTTTDANDILRQILDDYPGLDGGVVKEIMSYAELMGTLQPMHVRSLLMQMAGVPKGAADIIPNKYMLAMSKAMRENMGDSNMYLWNPGGGLANRPDMNFFPFFMLPNRNNPRDILWPGYPIPGGRAPEAEGYEAKESKADIERAKRLETIERIQEETNATIKTLIDKMTETEAQKREAAINARFEKLEQLIAQAFTSSKGEEEADPLLVSLTKQLEDTRNEILKVKSEASQKQIEGLEASVKSLAEALKEKDAEKLDRLVKDLEAAKTAKQPVTGKTEMDVVSEVVNKITDTAREAGKDLRTWLMSAQTREKFDPAKGNAAARKEIGEKAAEAIETEAAILEAEEAYLRK